MGPGRTWSYDQKDTDTDTDTDTQTSSMHLSNFLALAKNIVGDAPTNKFHASLKLPGPC